MINIGRMLGWAVLLLISSLHICFDWFHPMNIHLLWWLFLLWLQLKGFAFSQKSDYYTSTANSVFFFVVEWIMDN